MLKNIEAIEKARGRIVANYVELLSDHSVQRMIY